MNTNPTPNLQSANHAERVGAAATMKLRINDELAARDRERKQQAASETKAAAHSCAEIDAWIAAVRRELELELATRAMASLTALFRGFGKDPRGVAEAMPLALGSLNETAKETLGAELSPRLIALACVAGLHTEGEAPSALALAAAREFWPNRVCEAVGKLTKSIRERAHAPIVQGWASALEVACAETLARMTTAYPERAAALLRCATDDAASAELMEVDRRADEARKAEPRAPRHVVTTPRSSTTEGDRT